MLNIGNPLLSRASNYTGRIEKPMTVNGVVNKTGVLFAILMLAFGYTWNVAETGGDISTFVWGGSIAGLVLALIIIFGRMTTPLLIAPYAACQGLALGGISAIYEAQFPGIVMQAALLSTTCFCGIWLVYKMGWIRATPSLTRFITGAIFGIMLAYLASFIGGFLGFPLPFLQVIFIKAVVKPNSLIS